MDSLSAVSRMLSVKPEKTAEAVEKLLGEVGELKRKMLEAEKQKADEIISALTNESRKSFCVFTEGISRDMMREIANKAVLLTDGAAGVFGKEDSGYSYIIASENIPLREKSKEINAALGGKGGGSDKMIQGSVTADRQAIEDHFSKLD